jgi:hypothetical protein
MTNEIHAVDRTREELEQEIHAYKNEPSVLSPAAHWRHCPMTDFRALCARMADELEDVTYGTYRCELPNQ